jgi:hypothetical protein
MFQSGQKGTMVGTEGYSPPEQYRGSAEPRADIYALGATMHHLLSKQDPRLEPPFSFHERPIHKTNPLVSLELVEVINRALEYDVNDRYGSAEELKRVLMGVSSARGISGAVPFGAPAVVSSDVLALWRFACEDEVRSSPAVHNGVVYVGAYDHNVYAINAENGKFLWKYATGGGIASSPCVYEGRLFVGSADRILYAINAETGRISWTCPTKGGVWSSPRAAFDHVFFGSDDCRLYAVNVHSGRIAWTFEAEGPVRSSPTIGSDTIYVGCEGGIAYAVDISGHGGDFLSCYRRRDGLRWLPGLARLWSGHALRLVGVALSHWRAGRVLTRCQQRSGIRWLSGWILLCPGRRKWAPGLGLCYGGSGDRLFSRDRRGSVLWLGRWDGLQSGCPDRRLALALSD